MAGSMNKVILIGNLGRDPELKVTPGDNKLARFSLATSEYWKDKTSGERKSKTEWHNCIAWNNEAERAMKLLKKGKSVMVEGKLKYTKDKEDEKKIYANIEITNFVLLDKKDTSDGGGQQDYEEPHSSASGGQSQSGSDDNFDDDIPF